MSTAAATGRSLPILTRRTRAHTRARGFTLIEVMIVIAIILALSGLIGVALFSRQKEAKASLAQTDMNTIKQSMKLFYLDFDRFPTDEEGLAVLWAKETLSADADQTKWKKYLDSEMPNDRWGKPWGYRQLSEHGDETTYDLWSFGPDGQEGTDDDVVSWKKDAASDGSGSSQSSTPSKGN